MSKRFFTNEGENTLLKKFAGVFASNPDIERFDALVGYLRASGYFALRPHLEKVPLIRIIVGIDVDDQLARHHRKGLLMLGDADKTLAFVRAKLAEDVQGAPYRRDIEEGIRQFVADVASKRVEIRAHSTKRLHAKLYIFLPTGFCEHKPGAVITGSSNLTAAGLGVEDAASNYEFNVVLHDYDEVLFAKNEFEKLWNEGVSVLPEAVKGVVRESYLRDDLTPFELYVKFLIEYFGPAIDYDPNSERDLPKGVKSLSYQGDAVNDGWLKLQKHGGFFLADVVGLGKTIVATRIAKKFYYHNGFPNHRSHILIVTPPALKENWEAEMDRFGLDDAARVIHNGSLHKIRDPEKYDLIIVDEAHKFRNDTADGYDLLQKLCKTRTKVQLPNGEFARKKVILISATPLNNRPADIRNQVLLFQDGKDSTVIGNLQHFFAQRIKEYQVAINPLKTPDQKAAHAAVARIYELIREQVVQPLTVRRTRTDLVEDKRWKADLDAQGIIFPHVEKPHPILYKLDDGLDKLYDRTIQLLAHPDYDLGCDPFTADEKSFRAAIRDISQLPNLEMNFRRGDSLLDMVSNVPIRVTSDLLTGRSDDVAAIQKLGHELHKAKSAEKKKKLRVEILRRRLDLSQRVLEDERKLLCTGQQVGDLFGGDEGSDAEKRRRAEAEILQLDKALTKLVTDRKELEKLVAKPMSADFYRDLRKLEGADFDSPFNFVWRIDYAEIFTGKRAATTIAGDFNLGDELTPVSRAGGFDLIVGNPPFVTARNPVKRELYRERWKRVCHMKFLLVCPFFDLSFGLLKPDGQLGFIVSNAFAKREFGQPLIEDFFPTVDLQKVVDCSGLLFPGHGTPTCIVFGAQRKPDEKTPIRIAATLPGGGDLQTPPEDSPLWHTLSEKHEEPGFANEQVVVSNRTRKELSKWPWNFDAGATPTKEAIDKAGVAPVREFLFADVGFMFVIGRNDIFMLSRDAARRHGLSVKSFKALNVGDEIRNYELRGQTVVIFPYHQTSLELVKYPKSSPEARYFTMFEKELSDRPTFSGTFGEDGRVPYQYHQLPIERAKNPQSLAFAQISTHMHCTFDREGSAFNEKAPLFKLRPQASDEDHHLCAALVNSAGALFWLKQICFNKGAGEEEHRDRYEFAGGKIQQLPVPSAIAEKLRGKSHSLAERLTALSSACWKRGQELPSLALRKLFEQSGEAYAAWNAALPGHVPPHAKLPAPFTTTAELRAACQQAIKLRENLRVEMIALQEEMDWLVYRAYGLGNRKLPAAAFNWSDPYELSSLKRIQETQRPFRLWAATNGDFAQACKLIPAEWDEERQKVWTARLTEIRDSEHIRRIEQPVYKRRWDEQWKVSNSWLAGPVAYAQELVDAFRWWLVEKAEWHLENKAKGGPLSLDAWSIALASDARVQAAWPVIAEAIHQVELWKIESKDKKPSKPPKADASSVALVEFFRDAVNEETVPDGIPAGMSWEELEKKMTVPKQAKNVRGKLNVPRERFRQRADGYIWAGMTK